MKRKIALKRLKSSDLTLFEYHYRNTAGSKQKAINLDRGVFIDQFYPALPDSVGNTRVPIDLSIFGPGHAGLYNLQRKIKKEAKNWRLNGEVIFSPDESPARFNALIPNDFALIDFIGDIKPEAARMYLVAAKIAEDTDVHAALLEKYSSSFTARAGMLSIDQYEISELLGGLSLPMEHPLSDFLALEALEDVALGGDSGFTKIWKSRKGREFSREEFDRAKSSAEMIGRLGEELLNEWLEQEKQTGNIHDYQWESDTNAVAPYDFTLITNNKTKRRVDAKSTAGHFTNPLHVSLAELREMSDKNVPYDLYRLYSVNKNSCRLRIASDLHKFASGIISALSTLPRGVTIDSISIKPDLLPFDSELAINFADED